MKKVSVFLMLAMMVFAAFSYAPAANAAPNPPATLNASASVSEDFKTITLSFDSDFEPAADVDLKSAITIKKTGTDSFASLDESDSVSYDIEEPNQLILTLDTALVGKSNSIKIAASAVKLIGLDEPYAKEILVESIAGIDIAPPEYVGAQSDGNGVYLYFDENIIPVLPEDFNFEDEELVKAAKADFQSKIQIAQDGVHFSPLSDGLVDLNWDDLANSTYWEEWGGLRNYLRIKYYDNLQVVSGPNTKIKLAAGLLQDEAGHATPEMILSVSPPAIQSVAVSNGNRDITVKFDRDVYRTLFTSSDRDIVRIVTSEGSDLDLSNSDKAELVGDTLTLELTQPLSGDTNQVLIRGGTVQDVNGNYNSYDVATSYIQLSDTDNDNTPPKLVNYVFSNEFQDLTLIFNEDVKVADEAAFRESLQWFDTNHWGWHALPDEAEITVSGSSVTIHNEVSTDWSWYSADPLRGLTDLAGNVTQESIQTNQFVFANNNNIYLYDTNFSMDGRLLNLYFNANYDGLEFDEEASAVEALKGKIKISRDNGATFTPLSAEDKLFVRYNRIGILFKDAVKTGSIQLKIAEGEMTDRHHYSSNQFIQRTIAENGPDLAGYLFSNADSVLTFNDNVEWRNNVNAVTVYDDYSNTGRVLTDSEYELKAGKLTIRKGVIARDRYYYVTVEAQGYSGRTYEGNSFNSADVFYMTSPDVSTVGGITAKVFIYNQANDINNQNTSKFGLLSNMSQNNNNTGTQSVVFELFDGDTPVSIAAAELAVGTGTYTAKFNVSDAASASKNYKVKAFIVSSFNGETGDVGLSLGTVKTQTEIDEAIIRLQNNNNNY